MKYKCPKCSLIQSCEFEDLLTIPCTQCGTIINEFADIYEEQIPEIKPIAKPRSNPFGFLKHKGLVIGACLILLFLIVLAALVNYLESHVGVAKNVVVAPSVNTEVNRDIKSITLSPPEIKAGPEFVEIKEVISTEVPKTEYPQFKINFCSEATCTSDNSLMALTPDYERHSPDYLSQDVITFKFKRSEIPALTKGIAINIFYAEKE